MLLVFHDSAIDVDIEYTDKVVDVHGHGSARCTATIHLRFNWVPLVEDGRI